MAAEPARSLRAVIAEALQAYELAQTVRLQTEQTAEDRRLQRVREVQVAVQEETRELQVQRRSAHSVALAEQERSRYLVESIEELNQAARRLLERAGLAEIAGAPLQLSDDVAPTRRGDEEVASAFTEAHLAHADLRLALLRLGKALAADGRWDLVTKVIEPLLEGPPGPATTEARALLGENHYVAAQRLLTTGDWQGARRALQMLMGINPLYKEAQAMLRATYVHAAHLASERGRWDDAQEHLLGWFVDHGDDVEVRNLTCEAYGHSIRKALQIRRIDQAARLVLAAQAIWPDWPELRPLLEGNPSLAWAAGTISVVQRSAPIDETPLAVALSPNRQFIAAGGADKRVKVWEVGTAKLEHNLWEHFGDVCSIAYSADGQWLAAGSGDRNVSLWQMPGGEARRKFKGHRGAVYCLAISSDQRFLASGAEDRSIRLWDLGSGKVRHTLSGHLGTITSLSFSPDGTLLASGSADATIRLWEVQSGRELGTLSGHVGGIVSLAFAPNGEVLASGGEDRTVRLWEPRARKLFGTLDGHRQKVTSLAFSPDSQLLASGSTDCSVRLWSVAAGTAVHTVEGMSGPAADLAFSPDGTMLACGSLDLSVHIWRPVW